MFRSPRFMYGGNYAPAQKDTRKMHRGELNLFRITCTLPERNTRAWT